MSEVAAGRVRRIGSLVRRYWLGAAMLVSVGFALVGAVWSSAQSREDSLSDFSSRQMLLAAAVGADFEQRLSARTSTGAPLDDDAVVELLAGAKRIESPPDLLVLVARPGGLGFLTTDERVIPSQLLRTALDERRELVTIPRDEATAFGLPRRTAIAGLARASAGQGEWGIVVLSSAQRLRDRQRLEERRLAATVTFVAVAVAAFGFMARRRQRKELDLERQIAIATLQREREAALAKADKMAALAALSTGIAHEVGTPLGVIVGRVEQVLDGTTDDRSRAALDVVLEQVERIRRIVRGCLALARGDAPALVAATPRGLAERAAALVQHRFASAAVRLEIDVEEGLPEVSCEPALFEQALVNLLLNACEATPREGVVRFSVRASDRGVAFVVDDDGAGIREEVARRATEPFFTTRPTEGGSGLGLTIAREIVNHHAGTLTVVKRERGGTRARIEIGA